VTRTLRIGPSLLLAFVFAGCVANRLEVHPLSYEVDVRLDPVTSTLAGSSISELELLDPAAGSSRRSLLELKIHPALTVDSISADGAVLVRRKTRAPRPGANADGLAPASLLLYLDNPEKVIRLRLSYRGKLWQDVDAGEVEGEVHNFSVSAHVGESGIYLEPQGFWYPRVELPEGADPDLALSDFTLAADPVDGFELVAGLESQPSEDGRLHWRSPFPLDGLVLLGGPLERHTRVHGDVTLHAVVAPGKETVAADILSASAQYLDRYEPLIGPYPYSEFTVLEAFFSSGFAFPTCTQIAGSQLSEHQQYRRHGYLDHELLHNWWGNGVLVHPDDGNWCEGLASYLGNYGGFVLDGDEAGARKQRRNQSNFLSSIEEDGDKPLGTFGLTNGAGRGIGYQKGAAVFHMLERKIGPEPMLEGLRLLTAEQMGRHASWHEIREVMERTSGEDLSDFFGQWVRSGGAPRLELVDARWTPGEDVIVVELSQGETEFALDVPLRLHYGERWVDVTAAIDRNVQEVRVPCEPEGLTAIELDPDYHLFRKLAPEETMPTSNLSRQTERLLIVLPDGDVAAPYRAVASGFRRAVLGPEEEPHEGHDVVERVASELEARDLENTSVLILGAAVRSPVARSFLERTHSPVQWTDASFRVGDAGYSNSGEAVFFTVHHPDHPRQGVTVYYGNSETALSNAGVLTYYPNSLLVFSTPPGQSGADASGMPRARVVERIDFEFHDRVEF
jgi:hypothetical protein